MTSIKRERIYWQLHDSSVGLEESVLLAIGALISATEKCKVELSQAQDIFMRTNHAKPRIMFTGQVLDIETMTQYSCLIGLRHSTKVGEEAVVAVPKYSGRSPSTPNSYPGGFPFWSVMDFCSGHREIAVAHDGTHAMHA